MLVHKLQVYRAGLAGSDRHTPWPDDDTLFHISAPSAPVDDDDKAALQPRVTVLAQVSKREEQKLRAYVQSYPSGWKKRLALADQLCKMGYLKDALAAYEQVLDKQS